MVSKLCSVANVVASIGIAVGALALMARPAHAAPIFYSAGDAGAGSTSPRPNSDASASAFDLAAPPTNTITFENLPVTPYAGPLTLAPGVTYTAINTDVFAGVASGNLPTFGFNTTAGGLKYLSYSTTSNTNNLGTFTFATPIDAFGAYLTGVGSIGAAATITFSDGSAQTFTAIDQNNGGVQFFGFIDANASITQVSFSGNRLDVFGIDDVRYQTTSVPEPATMGLVGAATVLLLSRRRRR